MRGVEQKMYKEQESFKKKSHTEIEDAYIDLCSQLESYDAVFFPARVSIFCCSAVQVLVTACVARVAGAAQEAAAEHQVEASDFWRWS